MKKKIIAMALLMPILATSNFVSAADFDCSTLDKDSIHEVIQMDEAGDTLTTDQETLLENAKACKGEGGEGERGDDEDGEDRGEKGEMGERGDSEDGEERGEKGENKKSDSSSILSDAYKTKIDTVFDTLISSMSSYSDEEKITRLESFNAKISAIESTLEESTSYTESKKVTIMLVLDYLSNKVDAKIVSLDQGDDDISDIFKGLFD